MPSIPAFCDTCGAIFNSGFFAENSTNVTFSGCQAGPCPKCGGIGHIPDGVFNFIGDTIEILSAPKRTLKELAQLTKILQNAKAEESAEAIAERIRQEVPGLSKLADLLPKNRSELYGFLALILTVIQLMSQSPQPTTTVTVNQVIQQVSQSSPTGQAKKPKRKLGRNELCFCGSGKKHKRCCIGRE